MDTLDNVVVALDTDFPCPQCHVCLAIYLFVYDSTEVYFPHSVQPLMTMLRFPPLFLSLAWLPRVQHEPLLVKVMFKFP